MQNSTPTPPKKPTSTGNSSTTNSTNASETLIEFHKITKAFDDNVVNDDISLSITKGEIHALVGENGAGKSTLMKILFGLYTPDSGQIKINGRPVKIDSPVIAKKLGLGMVHQHFMLAGQLTALEHFFLETPNDPPFGLSPLPEQSLRKRLTTLSQEFDLPVPWDKKIDDIPLGIQQRIEILKLLFHKSKILIFDEPTAVLTATEAETFLQKLLELKKQGQTIILITHKLKEVMLVADRISILRRGKCTGTFKKSETNEIQIAELMVGRAVPEFEHQRDRLGSGNYVLNVRELTYKHEGKKKLNGLTFFVRPKEIVGIAGVDGNGQSELVQALISPRSMGSALTGYIEIKDKPSNHLSSRTIRSMGVNLLPEDRLKDALLPSFSVEENFFLGHHTEEDLLNGMFLNKLAIRMSLKKAVEKYDVRPRQAEIPAALLSGGNQQKLIIGRELMYLPDLLIAAHPTRGVDLGAVDMIHREFLELKKNGCSVVMISSDLDELMKICDRILVIYDGRIVGQNYYYEFNEKIFGRLMAGLDIPKYSGYKEEKI